jgi:hypothetical protein
MSGEKVSAEEIDEYFSEGEEEESGVEVLGKRRPGVIIRDLIVNPEVARALVRGTTPEEIAEVIGVSGQTVRKWMNRMEMADLLRIESKRVVSHLASRDLSKEKYLGLATALGGFIDKIEVLEHGIQREDQGSNTTIIQNIKIGLYGRGARGGSKRLSGADEKVIGEGIGEVVEEADSDGPAEDQ